MRIAALAFGVLAGIVASLILSLGGLDPQFFPRLDPRQVNFALFLIANLGVLGAGLALAAPLAAAILMLLAAAGWAGAAYLLRHGADYVLITPPALLAISAALAIIAFVMRPRELALEGAALAAAIEPAENPAQLRGLDQADQIRADGDWTPGKKRQPPRQEAVFRDLDDEDAESGFARFARGISTVLSFGLYAALAGAAVLIYLNLRTSDVVRPATVLETRSSALDLASSSSAPQTAPVLAAPSSSDPIDAVQTLLSTEPAGAQPDQTFRSVGPVPGPAAEASVAPAEPDISSSGTLSAALASASSSSTEVPVQLEPQNLLDPTDTASSSTEPDVAPTTTSAEPVMPFTVPPGMAAAREQPAPPPSSAAPQPAGTGGDTGL